MISVSITFTVPSRDGEFSMKTAVVFGTRKGASRDSATIVADRLREKFGFDVDLIDVRTMPAWRTMKDRYDAYVIGSSIVAGRWVGRARRLLFRPELRTKRVAIFVTAAGTLQPGNEGASTRAHVREVALERYVTPLLEKSGLSPVGVAAFGGRMRMLKQTVFENWNGEEARDWADTIGPRLADPPDSDR